MEFTAFIYLRIKLPHLPRYATSLLDAALLLQLDSDLQVYMCCRHRVLCRTSSVRRVHICTSSGSMPPSCCRPYQVPLPTWGCALMLLPAMGLLITIIAIPFATLQWKVRLPAALEIHLAVEGVPAGCAAQLLTLTVERSQTPMQGALATLSRCCYSHSQTMAWTVGAIVVGTALHPLLQAARRNNWCVSQQQCDGALSVTLAEALLDKSFCWHPNQWHGKAAPKPAR